MQIGRDNSMPCLMERPPKTRPNSNADMGRNNDDRAFPIAKRKRNQHLYDVSPKRSMTNTGMLIF
jgi:hypothetical protein